MHNAQNTHLRTNYLKENYKWYWWNFSKVKKKKGGKDKRPLRCTFNGLWERFLQEIVY